MLHEGVVRHLETLTFVSITIFFFTSLITLFSVHFLTCLIYFPLHSSLIVSSDLDIPRFICLLHCPCITSYQTCIEYSVMRGGCIDFFGLPALFIGGDCIVVVALHVPMHLWVMTSSACIFSSFRLKSIKGGVHPALNLGCENICI